MADLELNHISKSFNGNYALQDVTFSCNRGEVHALLGENGAGKSTLLKVLAGAYRPDSGEIKVFGQTAQIRTPSDAMRYGIGCVYQELSFIPELTVAENIFLGREPANAFGIIRRRQMAAQAATEEEIRGLFAILDRMKRGQTRFELMSVGHQFHLSLAQLAHNRVLYGFYVSAASQMRSMRVLESLTLEVYRSGIHEHAAIAEAIAHRDGALAAQRMREHLQNDYGPYLSELTAPQP